MIKVPISIGEAFDKLSILEIKRTKLSNRDISNIELELRYLKEHISRLLSEETALSLYRNLVRCNLEIWECMDELYALHMNKTINIEYAEICYRVTELNKNRAYLKREIDEMLESGIKEEKSYFDINPKKKSNPN